MKPQGTPFENKCNTPKVMVVIWMVAFAAVFRHGMISVFAAEFRLGSPFSDHMVLQREKPVAVWGWAEAGELVTVSFAGRSRSVSSAADGRWALELDPLSASAEPRKLTVTGRGGRGITIEDVLVGEVWLGSGQSNMEMSVGSANDFDAEKASANLPLIRYYGEASGPAEKPMPEGRGGWQVCTPESVRRFSATLYFFGREVHRKLDVPVGLICSASGATQIEYWIPPEAQSADEETKANYDSMLRGYTSFDEAKVMADYEAKLAAWKLAVEQAIEEKKAPPPRPTDVLAIRKRKGPPGGLYNGKIFNLIPFSLRGILWYQGESNAGNPDPYHKLLTELVTSWRALWHEELPFAWVQLPGFTAPGEAWPRMREAMLKATVLPRTGMAVTIDIGDPKNIHPTNKQEVGRRLSLWALGTVYGKNVSATGGPLPVGSSIQGSRMTVAFSQAGGGLKTKDGGSVSGFQIAGADQQWRPAVATIAGDKVAVSSADVAAPVAVRYAWQDFPECNLYNAAGLPASPFRTDEWPAAAAAKK